jgi:Na+/H+ antiporter NhaA
MKRATNWLLTILHDEVQAAFILIGVTAVTLVLALSPMQSSIVSFADLELWSHSGMTLRHFSSEWLLCIFFIIAGIELRYELQLGSLNSLKSALVPVMSAVFGMAIPAAIYIALAKDISTFGIVMPTDLPFALAAIAIFGKKMPLQFRAFVLSLAVVDDFLSVVALSLTSGHFEIHPTLIAVLIGLSLPLVRAERIHNVLRPVSNGVALPLFAFTALALPHCILPSLVSSVSPWGSSSAHLLLCTFSELLLQYRGASSSQQDSSAVSGFLCRFSLFRSAASTKTPLQCWSRASWPAFHCQWQ